MSRAFYLTMSTLFAVGLVVSFAGCRPKYPNCEKDEHCEKGEFCVNNKCQQCRMTADCKKGQECRGGRCAAIKGYCNTMADCPDGQACRNNRCVACASDGDCGAGGRCRNGKCLKPGACSTDDDCPENHECQNGQCVAPPSDDGTAKCTPEPVLFDFNEFVLTTEATRLLQAAADCIKSVKGRTIRVEGHCDPRGTEEYNLSLGDRRARSVMKYLGRLGVKVTRLRPVSKGKLEAKGASASGWMKDRKVLFIWE